MGGFTIPLDKRLAADGRGLQEQTINNNFATLSESLYIAERKAREELEARAKLTAKLKAKEKDQKEEQLREMASKARMQRAGIEHDAPDGRTPLTSMGGGYGGGGGVGGYRGPEPPRDLTEGRRDNRPAWLVAQEAAAAGGGVTGGGSERGASDRGAPGRRRDDDVEDDRHGGGGGGGEDAAGVAARDKLRAERRKEREREMRMENMKGEMKRSKHERERERDVSEKIALGLTTGAPKLQGDQQFDARLFNQSGGMSAGFGAEDDYNVYSKPLFDRGEAASVYRPKRDADALAEASGEKDFKALEGGTAARFKPDKGFRGADSAEAHARDGPVQFSKS